MPGTIEVDLTDAGLYVHGFPHDLFTELRRRGPVQRHRSTALADRGETGEFWVLLSHPIVQQANRDWETFSARCGPSIVGMPGDQQGHTLVSSDPPEHPRLRKLISDGFTPRMIRKLDEQIVANARRILDGVVEKGGEVDFVRAGASPPAVCAVTPLRNPIPAGLMAFAENPGEYRRLREDMALIDPATEEIIRWASPVT